MPPTSPRRRSPDAGRRSERTALAAEHTAPRPLEGPPPEQMPEIVVRAPTWHAHLFKRRLGAFPTAARHGELVRLVTAEGSPLGIGCYNPRAEVSVRVLTRSIEPIDLAWWDRRLTQAMTLRRELLRLDEVTTACRLVHAEGDGLPGIVIDRYGDVLVAEVYTLAMYQRSRALVERLAALCGTAHWLIRPARNTLAQEGFDEEELATPGLPHKVVIREHDAEFEVDLRGGHKTGFFCDQRENRRRLAEWRTGESLLDLCSYTGGFAVAAGRARGGEITTVDLDETAVETARRNAQRNRVRMRCVHADAFAYMRDMLREGRTFDTVVLDPPKLIDGRDEIEPGRRKYFDFNRLALQLVAPGGLLLTCSCSGLLSAEEFGKVVNSATPAGRRLQILHRSGAGGDHPVAGDCPETEYLKALWVRVL